MLPIDQVRPPAEERRVTRFNRTQIYKTRRDWMLAEIIVGIVSCATAITGISGGIVSKALEQTQSNGAWFWLFYGTGCVLILVVVLEILCLKRSDYSESVIRFFATVRMYTHFLNSLCWLSAFLWLTFTEPFVASIIYQSIPLMIFNLWGAVEHAKALWLKPAQAHTCSMVSALYNRMSRG